MAENEEKQDEEWEEVQTAGLGERPPTPEQQKELDKLLKKVHG